MAPQHCELRPEIQKRPVARSKRNYDLLKGTSVPIPKFARVCRLFSCELRNQRDTSNFMILVWLLDLKFLSERAATTGGTSNPPH
jgi:hypothetical protein